MKKTEETVVLKSNRAKILVSIVVWLLVVLLSVFLISHPKGISFIAVVCGWVLLPYSITYLFLSIYHLISPPSVLIISAEGVFPSCQPKEEQKLILWPDIEKITIRESSAYNNKHLKFLVINLKNPQKYNFHQKVAGTVLGEFLKSQPKGHLYVAEQRLPASAEDAINILRKYPVVVE